MRILSISTTILLTGMLALPAAAQGTLPRPGKDGPPPPAAQKGPPPAAQGQKGGPPPLAQ
jgi:hypothetical protein